MISSFVNQYTIKHKRRSKLKLKKTEELLGLDAFSLSISDRPILD